MAIMAIEVAVPGAYFFLGVRRQCLILETRGQELLKCFPVLTALHHLDVERRRGLRLPCKSLQLKIMRTFFFIF